MLPDKLIPNLSHIDRQAIESLGIPGILLMDAAGRAVADAAESLAKRRRLRKMVALCGPGNNGGDGFIAAWYLKRRGWQDVYVFTVGAEADDYRGDAAIALGLLSQVELMACRVDETATIEPFLDSDTLVIDAILGSGINRAMGGWPLQLVSFINQAKQSQQFTVLAVDLPSGLDSRTGKPLGAAVQADATVTFAASKPGLYLPPGKFFAGELSLVDIGIPPQLIEADESRVRLLTEAKIQSLLPKRQTDAHKYTVGHTLVIAGSRAMPGAAGLCARSALRSGTGMVTLAAPMSALNRLSLPDDIVTLPLPDNEDGTIAPSAADVLASLLSRVQSVAFGPGLGRSHEVTGFVQTLLKRLSDFTMPVVIDADGLFALSLSEPELTSALSGRLIITPHAGEWSRLMNGAETSVLTDDALACSQRWQAITVLKTSVSVVATPQTSDLWLSPLGNSGMATAGCGDVLTGLIAGLASQGVSSEAAALCGVWCHGQAGDEAQASLGTLGMTASDMIEAIPAVLSRLTKGI